MSHRCRGVLHFGDDNEIVRVRVKRLLDELIGYVRTVKVAGIDMVHSGGDDLAQNSDCTGNIARGTPDSLVAVLPGKLHDAVAHAVQGD